METNRKSKAYWAGLKDGLAWDLDGYSSAEEVSKSEDTWDESTINAMGADKFCELLGIRPSDWGEEPWRQACHDYNRGCYDGACAPQSERTGLPPHDQSEEEAALDGSAAADYQAELDDECIEADAKRLAKRVLEGSDLSMGWREAGYSSALDAARVIVGAGGPEHQRAAEIVAESLRK